MPELHFFFLDRVESLVPNWSLVKVALHGKQIERLLQLILFYPKWIGINIRTFLLWILIKPAVALLLQDLLLLNLVHHGVEA